MLCTSISAAIAGVSTISFAVVTFARCGCLIYGSCAAVLSDASAARRRGIAREACYRGRRPRFVPKGRQGDRKLCWATRIELAPHIAWGTTRSKDDISTRGKRFSPSLPCCVLRREAQLTAPFQEANHFRGVMGNSSAGNCPGALCIELGRAFNTLAVAAFAGPSEIGSCIHYTGRPLIRITDRIARAVIYHYYCYYYRYGRCRRAWSALN